MTFFVYNEKTSVKHFKHLKSTVLNLPNNTNTTFEIYLIHLYFVFVPVCSSITTLCQKSFDPNHMVTLCISMLKATKAIFSYNSSPKTRFHQNPPSFVCKFPRILSCNVYSVSHNLPHKIGIINHSHTKNALNHLFSTTFTSNYEMYK